MAKAGEPADTILQTATELGTDLIVMTTDGPDGFLDGLRGTTSERVLHGQWNKWFIYYEEPPLLFQCPFRRSGPI